MRFLLTLSAAGLLTAQIPDFTPPTPLFRAILRHDAAEVRRLLASGASPSEGNFLGFQPVFVPIFNENPEIFLALADKGADLNALDASGSTTLMWAAATETGDTRILDELLARGADPNVRNKAGETALDWAIR
ncbi:MAG: ankyrin repeat domain-containing protein, partial [Bryobacteraceae bacterium]